MKKELLDFIPRFLATAELKQASLCSFGLTKTFIIMLAFFLANTQTACSSEPEDNERTEAPGNSAGSDNNNQDNVNSTKMNITVNNTVLEVSLASNAATRALIGRLQNGSVTYPSSSYGNFETVGGIGFSLPTNNTNITTQAGDVILYQGNQICIFYGSNSWSYTRIGRITNASQSQLRNLLSSGTVNITLSLAADATGISAVTSSEGKPSHSSKGIYSLDGKRLSQVPQKGVYIEDGVKKSK